MSNVFENVSAQFLSQEASLLQPIISGILLDNDYSLSKLPFVQQDITDGKLRNVFKAIVETYDEGYGRDLTQIVKKAKEYGVEQKEVLELMSGGVTSISLNPNYITRYKEFLSKKRVLKISNDLMLKACSTLSTGDILKSTNDLIETISESNSSYSIGDNVENLLTYIDDRKGKDLFGYSFGEEFSFLDKATRGIQAGRTYRIGAPSNMGKAMPLYEKIKTPTGEITFGDVKVGDEILNSYGGTSFITGVFPQGNKKVYRVKFSDGTSADSCENHLWAVHNNDWNSKEYKVMELKDIIKTGIKRNSGGNKFSIPLTQPVELRSESHIGIDPYVMGILISEGNLGKSHIQITNCEEKVRKRIDRSLKNGDKTSNYYSSEITYGIVGGNTLENIRGYGLDGHRSYEKFIPEAYKYSSVDCRKQLLDGLIDGDGWKDESSIVYTTTSELLSKDVEFIARSLGGLVKTTTKIKTYEYKGEKKIGRLSYDVRISLPFELENELEYKRPKIRKRKLVKHIISVDFIGDLECKCISVSAKDSLYLTSDFIVTHNTQMIYGIINNLISQGAKVAFFSLENDKDMTLSNLLANRQKINSWDLESGKKDVDMQKLGEMDGKLFVIDDTHEISEIFSKVLAIKPDVVILDYIGLITINKYGESELFTEYAKRVQQFVKKTRVGWIDLSNLPIGVDDDEIIARGQFYGSSYLRNNADVGIHLLKYKEFYEYKTSVENTHEHRNRLQNDSSYRMNWISKKGIKVAITKNRIGPAGLEEPYIVNFAQGGRFAALTEAQKAIFTLD